MEKMKKEKQKKMKQCEDALNAVRLMLAKVRRKSD